MKKTLMSLATAATIGVTTISAPTKVEAHSSGWWIPGAVVGGLALGAIISSAYRPYYYYGPGPYYYYGPGPYYYGPGPYYYRPYRHYHVYRHRHYHYHY